MINNEYFFGCGIVKLGGYLIKKSLLEYRTNKKWDSFNY